MRAAFLTIGQSPRIDLVPEMRGWIWPGLDIVEWGALDGLNRRAIAALAPRKGEHRFVTRLADGSEVVVSKRRIRDRLQRVLDELPWNSLDFAVVLCTGHLPGLRAHGLLLESQTIVDHGVAALAAGAASVGVMLPLAARVPFPGPQAAADLPEPRQPLRAGPAGGGCAGARGGRSHRHALHRLYGGHAGDGHRLVEPAGSAGAPPGGGFHQPAPVNDPQSAETNEAGAISQRHPSVFEPQTLVAAVAMALLGVIIGLELLTHVGITPNTSIIGVIIAIAISRVPLAPFRPLASTARQNLLQTVISSATFGGANALLLPMGVLWLVRRGDLVPAMMLGALLGAAIDAVMLYGVFDSKVYPASGLWPPGIATAECIIAGDRGGARARLLAVGGLCGAIGELLGIPMDVFGVCWIGNMWALGMFGLGLLVRGYAPAIAGIDLDTLYVPHGVMIGAGCVALGQIGWSIARRRASSSNALPRRPGDDALPPSSSERQVARVLGGGWLAYLAAATLLSAISGIAVQMSGPMLVEFVVYAAIAALVSELIVGIAAMEAGWFPAFATALIFLGVGMVLRFPPLPLALLVGFTASTGPAFADMGYDLKTGWILRGRGQDAALESRGRLEQLRAGLLGLAVAAVVVLLVYRSYFTRDLLPPVDRVFAATIAAGATPGLARALLLWAIPGAIIQLIGGPSRQLGILFATGLLILNPIAGWTALASLTVRALITWRYRHAAEGPTYVLAGGFIAGSALMSFGSAAVQRCLTSRCWPFSTREG
jgi:uncharacterized oligopeptide transporter (OPT) family protein